MEERKNGRRKILIIGITLVLLTVSLSGCGEKLKPEINTDTQGAAILPGLDEGQEKDGSPSVEKPGQVDILFESFYYDDGDIYNYKMYPELYGEIQNTGETWVIASSIVVSIYGEYDTSDGGKEPYLLKEIEEHPKIGLLSPGQKSPFCIDDKGKHFSDYKTLQDRKDLTWKVVLGDSNSVIPRREKIELLDIKELPDYWNRIAAFDLKVSNLADGKSGGWVVATFYNNESRVIGYTSNTFELRPNELTNTRVDAIVGYSNYLLQLMTSYTFAPDK